ncbi:efflux transporter outer membrane subunit [Dyella flava]|uniref:TolC family protein n=1 Tax=Dyella flava TaxID=1920170 RepID=A0ABS2JZV0_9GAMM|nr:TolC family protein [Dyella flava]MBM7124530.1 TolC family protein [Dyella flava]GLQ51802.1 RND transporter [Dyella flava]
MTAEVTRSHWTVLLGASALAVGLVMAGCVEVGPDYQPPKLDLKPVSNPLAAPADTAPPLPLDTWWQGFKDPELDQIVDRVRRQNLDLAAALARVTQAQAVAEAAGARRLPSGELAVSADAEHQSLRSPIGELASVEPGYLRNEVLYDEGIGASWETDLFGGLRRGEEAAKAEAQAAEAGHLGTRVSVTADAVDAYVQIRGNQERLRIARRQIDIDTHLLSLIQQRNEYGASSDRELDQTRALVDQALATVPPLEIALQAQLNRLDVLMGAQPGTYASELRTQKPIPTIPTVNVSVQPEQLLRSRPDIVAAERHLAASNARIGVAISDYYPHVSLGALLGFESLGSDDLISAASFQPQLLAGLRWRLFDFGRVDAEVNDAKGAYAEALANYRQTALRATQEVEDALTAQAQYATQSGQLNAETVSLQRANASSERAYEAGSVSLTDVLDTERQLLAAQDEAVNARVNALRSAIFFYRAMGGGG